MGIFCKIWYIQYLNIWFFWRLPHPLSHQKNIKSKGCWEVAAITGILLKQTTLIVGLPLKSLDWPVFSEQSQICLVEGKWLQCHCPTQPHRQYNKSNIPIQNHSVFLSSPTACYRLGFPWPSCLFSFLFFSPFWVPIHSQEHIKLTQISPHKLHAETCNLLLERWAGGSLIRMLL